MTTLKRVTPNLIEDFVSKVPTFELGEDITCLDFTCAKKENGKDILYCLVRNKKRLGIHLILGMKEIHINGRESESFLMDWHSYLYFVFGEDFLKELKAETCEDLVAGGLPEPIAQVMIDSSIDAIKNYSIRKYGIVEDINAMVR